MPFGFILGVAVVEAPIDSLVGWFGAWFIFGGAAQLTMITLLSDQATALAAVLAALVVNARHIMYSMAMASRFQDQPTWFRWIGPYGLLDQVYALSDLRRDVPAESFRQYYLGAASMMLVPWTLWVALGTAVGGNIPEGWNLGFAVPVLFLGLMVLGIRSKAGAIAAAAAFGVTVVLSGLPNRAGLLIGAVAGVAIAALVALPAEDST